MPRVYKMMPPSGFDWFALAKVVRSVSEDVTVDDLVNELQKKGAVGVMHLRNARIQDDTNDVSYVGKVKVIVLPEDDE